MEGFFEGYKGLHSQKLLDYAFLKLLEMPAVPHLTERKVGQFEVKIEIVLAGKDMTVVSARNWLLMGYKQQKCVFTNARPLYKLLRNGGLLMSDSPQEMFLQYEAYKEAHGRVLVGGLGLGMSPSLFANKGNVSEVVVVEIEKDIITLCRPKNGKIKVVRGDIWNFLKTTKESFDFIYIDIHYGTHCGEYLKTVIPMRKILEERFANIPSQFWGEEEMKSQYDPNFEAKKAMLQPSGE